MSYLAAVIIVKGRGRAKWNQIVRSEAAIAALKTCPAAAAWDFGLAQSGPGSGSAVPAAACAACVGEYAS